MSISTKRGDDGNTNLIGGRRVSKGDLRVEAYGAIDELISAMGFARSICENEDVRERTKQIQRELFVVSSSLATPPQAKEKDAPSISGDEVDALTQEVHRSESLPGILDDWALPGEHPGAAAFDIARTICRRAEREVVRLTATGEEVGPHVISYLNRLSDLLWLFGRRLEKDAGVDGRLRDEEHPGPKWSRAW